MSDIDLIQLESGSYDDVIESQSHNLVYNVYARKLNHIMRERRRHTPRFLYADNNTTPIISYLDYLQFAFEIFLRAIIRQRHYKIYRYIYLLRRPTTPLRYFMHKYLRG